MADNGVDAAELAALERAAQRRDSVPAAAPEWTAHPYVNGVPTGLCAACGLAEAAEWHIVDVPVAAVLPPSPPSSTLKERAAREPAPPKPLASFVEAGAVDARLSDIQNELAQVRGMLHHVMVLVMVMGDRQHVSRKEYDAAVALIARGEKAGPA